MPGSLENIVTFEEFAIPWLKSLGKWGSTESVSVDGLGPVREALSSIYNVAFRGEPVSCDIAKRVDWLLMLLSPEGENDWEGLALLPESFWNTVSGKGLFRAMSMSCAEDILVPIKRAAEILDVSEQRLYHLAVLRRIPCFPDYREKNPRKRRRLRVDLLRDHYLPVIETGQR